MKVLNGKEKSKVVWRRNGVRGRLQSIINQLSSIANLHYLENDEAYRIELSIRNLQHLQHILKDNSRIEIVKIK